MADYTQRLRTAGLRVTRPRIAVLDAVHTNPHSDTETIFRVVRDCLPYGSRQTVYDILHALTRAGVLRRVQPAGSVGRYETRVGDNHHHAVCRSCGVIVDVDCVIGPKLCLTAANVSGFQLSEAEVFHWGRCADCAAANGSQIDGDHSPIMNELRTEMLCPSDAGLVARSSDRLFSMPTPRPGDCLAPALLTPITVFKQATIGAGGLGAGAGWARRDVADVTLTGTGDKFHCVSGNSSARHR